jgi:hypothetical protein
VFVAVGLLLLFVWVFWWAGSVLLVSQKLFVSAVWFNIEQRLEVLTNHDDRLSFTAGEVTDR